MLDFIANIFKYPMQLFYNWTGSYLIALTLFALLVRLVIMLPVSIQQQRNQIKSAKLRPKIAIIEKKYKNRTDQESRMKMQQEIMDLRQQEGISTFAGCLPLLIQLPVIMGLYQVIRKPLTYMMNVSSGLLNKIVELVNKSAGEGTFSADAQEQLNLLHAIREHGLQDEVLAQQFVNAEGVTEQLSGFPDMTLFNGAIDLSSTPQIAWSWLLLIPILSAALSYLSMKVNRWMNPALATANGTPTPEVQTSNRIMDLMMPAMSIFISFSVPAAVGYYWMVGYVFSIIQTIILSKLMPLPTFTEEEIRQYEKDMKASRAKSNRVPTDHLPPRRSLHHIDDDDAVDPTPAPKKQPPKSASKIEAAPQKDDKK
ncbi:MAG: YidC/Oxa1 family membrane protein insertase [Clostridia bacterium]|nr:YidC/Oxa1 family membrane protein insertase [Clostridia bacterium]